MEVFRLKKYDLDDVKRLIDLANKNDLGVLEIETKKGRRIRIERNKPASPAVTFTAGANQEPVNVPVQAPTPAPVATTTVATAQATSTTQVVSTPESQPKTADKTIDAPMVGVFYQAPSPDAEPFVKVGQSVKKGDTVCIIEAMKLMNEIQAEEDGVITEVLAKNGEIIEFGQPLFAIK